MGKRTRARSERGHVSVDAAVEAAVASAASGVVAPDLVDAVARWPAPDGGSDPADRALATALVAAMGAAWQAGWQPADVHRVVERRHGRAHARVAARAIGREAQQHGESEVPLRWRRQLDAIGAADNLRADHDDTPWAVPWPPSVGEPGPARVQAIEVAIVTVALVRSLPRLPRLGPVPGEATAVPGPRSRVGRRGDGGEGADPRVIRKVTALLAKAESTSFPDEAEALTAKAQEMMTRHAIDRAHVEAGRGGAPRVGGRRVGIDDPYAGARYLLLAAVAGANRCRAVWTKQWGFSTVFGDEGDLDAVELLYTSLLVQATRAMVAEPRPASAASAASGGGTRSFRHAFLIAFADRIGERLAAAAESVTAEGASRSTALVPLFAARREAAEGAMRQAFPETRTARLSARNAAGWQAGTRAADRAQLDLQAQVGSVATRLAHG